MPKYNSILDIKEILDEYSQDVQEGITNATIEVANEGKDRLRKHEGTYEIHTGKYNKGWKVKTETGKGYISCTIHNTQYQLTHLLEKGHIKRNGKGKTRAFVHIAPVEKKCITEYTNDVENIIKNGG